MEIFYKTNNKLKCQIKLNLCENNLHKIKKIFNNIKII